MKRLKQAYNNHPVFAAFLPHAVYIVLFRLATMIALCYSIYSEIVDPIFASTTGMVSRLTDIFFFGVLRAVFMPILLLHDFYVSIAHFGKASVYVASPLPLIILSLILSFLLIKKKMNLSAFMGITTNSILAIVCTAALFIMSMAVAFTLGPL